MIPILIAGAVVGMGAHAYANVSNKEAIQMNNEANKIIDEASKLADISKTKCSGSMEKLAQIKMDIMRGNLKRFVKYYSKIKPVNFTDIGDSYDLSLLNKNELSVFQDMVNCFNKSSKNEVIGGVSGVVLAVGAADVIAGGTILGGASLSVGGLAGGAAIGAIAAPVFAVTGIFSASEASANLEKAKSNMIKAETYKAECETYSLLANSVADRCDLFYQTLFGVNTTMFAPAVNNLENIVKSKRTIGYFIKNISGKIIYTREEKMVIMSAVALAKMVKTIIEANILDKNGNITESSEQVISSVKYQIEEMKQKEQARMQAEQQARMRSEQQARMQAEYQARMQAEQQTRMQAEQQARMQAEYQARMQAEQQTRMQAEQQVRMQAEQQVRMRAEQQARMQAEQQARMQAEQQTQMQAELQNVDRMNQEKQINLADSAKLYSQDYFYNQSQAFFRNNYQSGINEQINIKSHTDNNNIKYKPHILTQIFMWICVVWWCIGGLGTLVFDSFIAGVMYIAGGLIMCPLIKRDIRFWPKFFISFVLVIIAMVIVTIANYSR